MSARRSPARILLRSTFSHIGPLLCAGAAMCVCVCFIFGCCVPTKGKYIKASNQNRIHWWDHSGAGLLLLCAAQQHLARELPSVSHTRRCAQILYLGARRAGESCPVAAARQFNKISSQHSSSNNKTAPFFLRSLEHDKEDVLTYMHLIFTIGDWNPTLLHYAMGVKGEMLCFGTQPLWQWIHFSFSTHTLRILLVYKTGWYL